ncbi:hypothetical protein [Candidatus Entotheonella palauensis]|uniref:hypothetical protein n=1 Tax=Candidatus Entotheonella palauensis TaxID=93172 RepID=UPI001C4E2A1A|nr:hypothetical protein [Candidatus Entotheonella palauensis]
MVGLFGACLPEIVRLRNLLLSNDALPEFSVTYFLISIIFVIAAGIFCIGWKPENAYKGMWIGASFPVIVSKLVQEAPSLTQ